jgi:hypothetical protein
LHGGVGKNKLKDGVVNAGEVAATRGLVLLGAKGEGVHVDTSIGGTGVGLVGLDLVEVGTLTLREAVLAVKLKLGNNNGVKTPAMHVKGSLGKHKGSSIRDGRNLGGILEPGMGTSGIRSTSGGVLEKTRAVDEVGGTLDGIRSAEGMEGVGKSIDGISVVEGLGTKGVVKHGTAKKRTAVVNIGIRLDNPYKLLTGVVEVKLNLVGRRTNRLITSELELLNEVLMRVLGHSAALISVKEHVVNVKRSSYKRVVVGISGLLSGRGGSKVLDGPQALINGAKVKVDLDLVVLKSNKGKSKTRVAAVPELKRHVKSGLGKRVARSTHLGGDISTTTGSIDIGEVRVSDVGELSGVTNHLVVTTLLLGGHGKLIPDVHPVTILTVNALTTNLNLDLGNKLLAREIQPTGMLGLRSVDLGKSNLEICAVSKITITADRAGHTAAEIGLTVESLFNGFH